MQTEKIKADTVEVPEEEIQLYDLDDAEDADAEIFGIDESLGKNRPCQVA